MDSCFLPMPPLLFHALYCGPDPPIEIGGYSVVSAQQQVYHVW